LLTVFGGSGAEHLCQFICAALGFEFFEFCEGLVYIIEKFPGNDREILIFLEMDLAVEY
jgi:hypothetical protein